MAVTLARKLEWIEWRDEHGPEGEWVAQYKMLPVGAVVELDSLPEWLRDKVLAA